MKQLDLFSNKVFFVHPDGWKEFCVDDLTGVRVAGPGFKCPESCPYACVSHFMVTADGRRN